MASKSRPHFTSEFTPGRSKGIDYMFGGDARRLKKPVSAAPEEAAPAPSAKEPQRRMLAEVPSRPKDNQEQLWPSRGLKKVESAPKDNVERGLFQKRTLTRPADVPQDKKERPFMAGGKAMVSGRSHTSSGNILSWN